MKVLVRVSRGKCIKREINGRGMSIEMHVPDELVEDREAFLSLCSRVQAEVGENLKDGVLHGNPLHFALD